MEFSNAWLVYCCLTSQCMQYFSCIQELRNCTILSWRELVTFWCDDDSFVLDQHSKFDFLIANSLYKQSASRHVTPFAYIILIPNLSVFIPNSKLRVLQRIDKYQFNSVWYDPTGALTHYLAHSKWTIVQ